MKKRTEIKQHDITDCGAACLASISAHYQLQIPIARIRQLAHTDQRGTNVLGMIEAAEKLGFEAKGVRGKPESLPKIPLPAIAHVIVPSPDGNRETGLHHFVVLYEVKGDDVLVMDPAEGQLKRKKLADFLAIWTGVLILLLPTENFQVGNEKIAVASRFWALIRPHKTVMLEALFGAIIYTVLGLSTSIYVQKIVDHVLVEGNRNLLNLLSVGMIVILVLQMVIGTMKTLFVFKTGQQIDAQLILGYYKHLLKLPQRFFDTMRVGEIISRINDAVKIRVFINDVALNLVVDIFIVLFSFGMMFTYDWKLALLMMAILPLYGLTYGVANRFNRKYQRQLMERSADLEAQLVESLQSMATIKRFGVEDFANQKTEGKFIALLRTIFSSGVGGLYINNASALITQFFTILLLWVGSGLVLDREITPGELLSFYALIGYFTGPAAGLIGLNKTLQDALIAADRLFEIMDLEREKEENSFVLQPKMIGDIRFEQVTFRYGSRATLFEDLNVSFQHQKMTAVVGHSGSGKSTLLSLLQNLYPIQSGGIFIGSMNIKYAELGSLRKHISVVPQQIDLMAGTVIENIALGDYQPDMELILEVCQRLDMISFIEKLPNGFQTVLGERGANLSGGQRQKIAIARALYRQPSVLILDEASSALDGPAEKRVLEALAAWRDEGMTIIAITHRLSIAQFSDQVIVMEDGKVIESGPHENLISHQGPYAQLWAEQFNPLFAHD